MLNIAQFRKAIVKASLEPLNLYTPDVEELMVITCANESIGGTFVAQEGGPALGIYQMEPATHDDIWKNWILNRRDFAQALFRACNFTLKPLAQELITNVKYATIMARVQYLRSADPIPSKDDINAQIAIYKKVYNTPQGAAKDSQILAAYKKFAGIK